MAHIDLDMELSFYIRTATRGENKVSLREVTKKLGTSIQLMMCTEDSLQARLDLAILQVISIAENEIPPDFRSEFGRLLNRIDDYREGKRHSKLLTDIPVAILQLFSHIVVNTMVSPF